MTRSDSPVRSTKNERVPLYVTVNMSSGIERFAGNPSYRPTIDAPWAVSLLGAAGSLAVMFLISPYACAAAIFLEFLRRALGLNCLKPGTHHSHTVEIRLPNLRTGA